MEKGEFKERLLEYNNSNGDLGVSEGLHFAIKVVDEARKDLLVDQSYFTREMIEAAKQSSDRNTVALAKLYEKILKWFGENKE